MYRSYLKMYKPTQATVNRAIVNQATVNRATVKVAPTAHTTVGAALAAARLWKPLKHLKVRNLSSCRDGDLSRLLIHGERP